MSQSVPGGEALDRADVVDLRRTASDEYLWAIDFVRAAGWSTSMLFVAVGITVLVDALTTWRLDVLVVVLGALFAYSLYPLGRGLVHLFETRDSLVAVDQITRLLPESPPSRV